MQDIIGKTLTNIYEVKLGYFPWMPVNIADEDSINTLAVYKYEEDLFGLELTINFIGKKASIYGRSIVNIFDKTDACGLSFKANPLDQHSVELPYSMNDWHAPLHHKGTFTQIKEGVKIVSVKFVGNLNYNPLTQQLQL